MDTDEARLNAITERIIGCAFRVGSRLGSGFAEKCYENALLYELQRAGLSVQPQVPLKVWYDDTVVGEFFADVLVEGVIILELKAVSKLDTVHAAQCINYLAATKLPLCLLINFARRVEVKRIAGPSMRDAASVSICAPSVANPLLP